MAFALSSLLQQTDKLLTSDHASVVSMNLFVALLCACIVIGHLLEENRWVNESITALIIVSFQAYCCSYWLSSITAPINVTQAYYIPFFNPKE